MRTDLLRSTLYLNIGTRYLKKMKEFYTSIPTLLFTTRLAFHIARRMNYLSRRLHTHQADIVGIKDRRRIDSHKLDINNGATSKREWIKHFSRYPISNACRSGVWILRNNVIEMTHFPCYETTSFESVPKHKTFQYWSGTFFIHRFQLSERRLYSSAVSYDSHRCCCSVQEYF